MEDPMTVARGLSLQSKTGSFTARSSIPTASSPPSKKMEQTPGYYAQPEQEPTRHNGHHGRVEHQHMAPPGRAATAGSAFDDTFVPAPERNSGYYAQPEQLHIRAHNGHHGRIEQQQMAPPGRAASAGSAFDDDFSPAPANQDLRSFGRGQHDDPMLGYGHSGTARSAHASSHTSGAGSSPAGSPAPPGQTALLGQPQNQAYPRAQAQRAAVQPSAAGFPSDNMQKLTEFADMLANSSPMKFSIEQRQDLQDFAKISSRVAPPGDVMMALMNRSLIHQAALLSERNHQELVQINAALTELKRNQVKNWTLSLDHKELVRTIAKRLIIEPQRTKYTKLHEDVTKELEDRQKALHIEDIIKHDLKLKALNSWSRAVSIQIRNFLREYIERSVGLMPNKPGYRGLIDFAQYVLAQFSPNNKIVTLSRQSEVVMKLVVLRRFALDNRDLATVDELDEEQTDEIEGAAEGGPQKRKRLSTAPAPAKPKGKVSVAKSFFGRFEAYLRTKSSELGSSDITSKPWAGFISQLINQDFKEFPDEANEAFNFSSTQAGPQTAVQTMQAQSGSSGGGGGGGGLGSIAAMI